MRAISSSGFIDSAFAQRSRFGSAQDLAAWLLERARANQFEVRRIPLAALDQWSIEADGSLGHRSGRFFRVEGIDAHANFPWPRRIVQPIIRQSEIGILGFLAKEFDGLLHLLVQAKMEPGNVNLVQLSPTVQATKSNYSQVHQGARPRYLDYFLDRRKSKVWVDQLQPEQGTFFLRKRNRNMIVQVDGEIDVHPEFRWATLGQINSLLREENLVNMDSRTVLSCIPFYDERYELPLAASGQSRFQRDLLESLFRHEDAVNDTAELISWFTELKTGCELTTAPCAIDKLPGWTRSANEIARNDGRYFSVIAISVRASNREVAGWTQPIVAPRERGIVGFLVRRIGGLLHFLVQARLEPGSFDLLEMAPTVQYLPGEDSEDRHAPFLKELLGARDASIRHDSIQSEEGGRFYHYRNRNMVVELPEDLEPELPRNFAWMSLRQIKEFLRYNQFNIEARGLLACLGLSF